MRVVEYLEPVGSGGRHAAVDLVGADMRRVDVLGRTAARDDRPANTRTDLVPRTLPFSWDGLKDWADIVGGV